MSRWRRRRVPRSYMDSNTPSIAEVTHLVPKTRLHPVPDRPAEATQSHRLLLDIPALAVQLSVTERFVRRLVEERRVPFHKIGKFIRFHPADIDKWVNNQKVPQRHDR